MSGQQTRSSTWSLLRTILQNVNTFFLFSQIWHSMNLKIGQMDICSFSLSLFVHTCMVGKLFSLSLIWVLTSLMHEIALLPKHIVEHIKMSRNKFWHSEDVGPCLWGQMHSEGCQHSCSPIPGAGTAPAPLVEIRVSTDIRMGTGLVSHSSDLTFSRCAPLSGKASSLCTLRQIELLGCFLDCLFNSI